jgi:hypothetical protein
MIIASGYVELDGSAEAQAVVGELRCRGVEVPAVEGERVVYLVERESAGEARRTVDGFVSIPGVRAVYLTYFSVDDAPA